MKHEFPTGIQLFYSVFYSSFVNNHKVLILHSAKLTGKRTAVDAEVFGERGLIKWDSNEAVAVFF